MEAVREILSFAEHQALVLLGTIWMRYPSLCLSGAKLRLKSALGTDAPQTTTATIGNMPPQDLKTIVFRIFRCYFAAVNIELMI